MNLPPVLDACCGSVAKRVIREDLDWMVRMGGLEFVPEPGICVVSAPRGTLLAKRLRQLMRPAAPAERHSEGPSLQPEAARPNETEQTPEGPSLLPGDPGQDEQGKGESQ
jgi:hypothetical protein